MDRFSASNRKSLIAWAHNILCDNRNTRYYGQKSIRKEDDKGFLLTYDDMLGCLKEMHAELREEVEHDRSKGVLV